MVRWSDCILTIEQSNHQTIITIATLRVFEHQSLHVGDRHSEVEFTEKHLATLVHYQSKARKYYRLIHRGVRFSYYVGVLQVNDLTIEILPKADRAAEPNRAVWHGVLLDMLRYCRLLKIETLGNAPLQLRQHSILDLYYDIFLTEVEQLLKTGLLRTYRRQRGQSAVVKGKLLLTEHLRRNAFHRERFYLDYQTYDYQHPLNQMLYAALLRLENLLQRADLRIRQQRLLQYFPPQSTRRFTEQDFQQLRYDRQTLRYQNAIEVARLLLLNYSPDIRTGQQQLLAILFDMNLLFEEYVYQQLKRSAIPNVIVKRQQATPFWNRRILRPDIVLEQGDKRYVLDTKWKVLDRVHPNMADVKQMYIYNRFFAAQYGVLLYPQVHDLPQLQPIPYAVNETPSLYCQITFVNLLKNNCLNLNLGREIWQNISHNN